LPLEIKISHPYYKISKVLDKQWSRQLESLRVWCGAWLAITHLSGWPQMLWSKGIHLRLPYHQHFKTLRQFKQCLKVTKELLGPVQKFVKWYSLDFIIIQYKQVTNILQYKPKPSYNNVQFAEINLTQFTFKIPPNSVMIIILKLAEISKFPFKITQKDFSQMTQNTFQ